jgi:hypothetical protein
LIDIQNPDLQTDFIQELDEDWLEETKIDHLIRQKEPTLIVKIPLPSVTINPKQNAKNKQLSITQFFKFDPI